MLSTLAREPIQTTVPTSPLKGDAKARARQSAEDYEAMFLSTMMKHMFPAVDAKDPFRAGNAEETWRGMLIDQYGKSIAKSGGIGVADTVYREMIRIQEGKAP